MAGGNTNNANGQNGRLVPPSPPSFTRVAPQATALSAETAAAKEAAATVPPGDPAAWSTSDVERWLRTLSALTPLMCDRAAAAFT
ncbi:hypothetical protein HK405_001345, partial [Cladochytrium tenue]